MHLDGVSIAEAIDEAANLPSPTTGDAGKVVTVNDAEDGYELDAPSGGSEPLLHVAFPFSFDTPGLSDGIEVTGWTPAIGDVVLNGWVSISEVWDGTTPTGDISIVDGGSWFASYANAPLDMTQADSDAHDGLDHVANVTMGEYFWDNAFNVNTEAPLKLWVSQDGSQGGTAVDDATQGQAVLHLLVLPK